MMKYLQIKNLSNEEFNEKVESIILKVSLIFFLISFIIMAFIKINVAVSIAICYGVSVLVFIKNNKIITNFLYGRMMNPRFWMTFNNLVNMVIYIVITLVLQIVPYFSLFGIVGLFFISISSIIVGLIKNN